MSGTDQPVDVTSLSAAWESAWRGCPPVAPMLRRRFGQQLVRFHTLPEGKRYATSDAEHAEILRRHHVLLADLLGSARCDGALIAVTCSWSGTAPPTPRHQLVARTTPGATHWRSDDRATEPGFHSWQHHYVSRTALDDPALDQLLLCVADDNTDGVILTTATCPWLYCPYDGGTAVFAGNAEDRDRLADAYTAWLFSSRT